MAGGRKPIDYSAHREIITNLIVNEKRTIRQVLDILKEEHGAVGYTKTTLERNLRRWDIFIHKPVPDSEELRARVMDMFYQWRLKDDEMVELLVEDGYEISKLSLRVLRKKMGLGKRVKPQQYDELSATIRDVLLKEMEDGAIQDMGREDLYAYIRNKYSQHHIIGRYVRSGTWVIQYCTSAHIPRNRVFSIAKELNPEGARRRQKKNQFRRKGEELSAPSPPHPEPTIDHAWATAAWG